MDKKDPFILHSQNIFSTRDTDVVLPELEGLIYWHVNLCGHLLQSIFSSTFFKEMFGFWFKFHLEFIHGDAVHKKSTITLAITAPPVTPVLRPEYSTFTRLISLLPKPWSLALPGYQQPICTWHQSISVGNWNCDSSGKLEKLDISYFQPNLNHWRVRHSL